MADRTRSLLYSITFFLFCFAPLKASDFKVGVIDISRVLEESDWGKGLHAKHEVEVEALSEPLDELRAALKKITAQMIEWERAAGDSETSASDRRFAAENFRVLSTKRNETLIRITEQEKRTAVETDESWKEIVKAAMPGIREQIVILAEQRGITFVVDKSAELLGKTSPYLYLSPLGTFDLTDELIKRLSK